MPSSRGSSPPRDQTCVCYVLAGRFFATGTTEAGGLYRGVKVKKRSVRVNPSLSHVLTQRGTSGHGNKQIEEMTQRRAGESIVLLSQLQSSKHEHFFSTGPSFSEGLG